MRIMIMTDIEGVAGVSSPGVDTSPGGSNYPNCKRLLTEEVNAAVRGFLKAGATELLIFDGHGSGAIDYEVLQSPAKLIHGRPLPPITWLIQQLCRRVDAICHIGQHAMAGVRDGNLNHTQNSLEVLHYKLNGRPIGEIAQFVLLCGECHIPHIFLAGDAAACREAEELNPKVVTACVKEGLGRTSSLTLSAQDARALIEQQAEVALKKHLAEPIPPLRWPGPYVLQKCFLHTECADSALGASPVSLLDSHTVEIRGETIAEVIYQ
ncbi:MAG: M55 family metallopeptidase [Lentisphaeria bacterium]